MLGWIKAHWKPLAVVLAVVLTPLAANGLSSGPSDVFVSANAPQKSANMTVLVAVSPGFRGDCSGTADVEILRGEIIVYNSVYTEVPIENCEGQVNIPYERFASKNAIYTVKATFEGKTSETRIFVKKVVNWVYVRTFNEKDNDRVRVEVALDTLRGQPLTSSVFTSGELELSIFWENCESDTLGLPVGLPGTEPCQAQHDLVFHTDDPIQVSHQASLIIYIPWDAMDSSKFDDGRPDDGWYNVTATYHNHEAKGNANVPQDPSVYQEDPPGNWFEVDYR